MVELYMAMALWCEQIAAVHSQLSTEHSKRLAKRRLVDVQLCFFCQRQLWPRPKLRETETEPYYYSALPVKSHFVRRRCCVPCLAVVGGNTHRKITFFK
jgi:hypothetical protein